MIGQINFNAVKVTTDDSGHMDLVLSIAPESKYATRQLIDELKKILSDEKKLTAKFHKVFNKRTLRQNALMWELCELIAEVHNGGRTGDITAYDVYVNAIEEYGSKYEYIQCLKQAEPLLRASFRAVKYIKPFDEEKDLHIYKCFYGSSKFNTKEMSTLIDGLLDTAEALGIQTDKFDTGDYKNVKQSIYTRKNRQTTRT